MGASKTPLPPQATETIPKRVVKLSTKSGWKNGWWGQREDRNLHSKYPENTAPLWLTKTNSVHIFRGSLHTRVPPLCLSNKGIWKEGITISSLLKHLIIVNVSALAGTQSMTCTHLLVAWHSLKVNIWCTTCIWMERSHSCCLSCYTHYRVVVFPGPPTSPPDSPKGPRVRHLIAPIPQINSKLHRNSETAQIATPSPPKPLAWIQAKSQVLQPLNVNL